MKSISTKKLENLEYIIKEIGIETWSIIKLFEVNTLDTFNTISILQNVIENDSSILIPNLTKVVDEASDSLRIKQKMILDVIIKLQIVLESLLILVDSLSEGYKETPTKMLKYGECFRVVDRIKSRGYTEFWKILGLAPIEGLDILNEEKKFLFSQYQKVENHFYQILDRLCYFYNKYYDPYLKGKHGLSMIPDISSLNKEYPVTSSSMVFYANRSEEQVKRSRYIEINTSNSRYFNTIVYLNFNEKLVNEIKETIADLQKIITFVCELHIANGMNCGEGYLPFDNTKWIWPVTLLGNDYTTFDTIAKKIWLVYNTQKDILNLNIESSKDDIVDSVKNESITVIFSANSPKSIS